MPDRAFNSPARGVAALLGATCLALSGCATAPDPLAARAAPTPTAFPGTTPEPGTLAKVGWRDFFQDPALRALIEQALANNRDVQVAAGRVEEARAALRLQGAVLYPGLGAVATTARGRTPADLSITRRAVTASEHRAVLSAAWELDFWGRLGQLRESARRQYLAAGEAQRAVAMGLIAQVANGFLLEREYEERIALARHTVASREESLRILRRRFEVGSGSKLEVTQAQTLLTQARTAVQGLERDQAINRNTLAFLVGGPVSLEPGALTLTQKGEDEPLPPGLPSELLVHRPDIIAAEHQLRAASANVAAARAAYFPSISLTGTYGSASAELDGLFRGGSQSWSLSPRVDLPIFDAGRRDANLALTQARQTIVLASYERTVQAAFRDVSDALAQRQQLAAQIATVQETLAALKERARLADMRFANGRSTYLEVLDAQRDLFETEQALVQLRRARLASGVALYAAVGGGLADQPDFASTSKPAKEPTR